MFSLTETTVSIFVKSFVTQLRILSFFTSKFYISNLLDITLDYKLNGTVIFVLYEKLCLHY